MTEKSKTPKRSPDAAQDVGQRSLEAAESVQIREGVPQTPAGNERTDMADPQRECNSLSLYEVKQRLKRGDLGPTRPLAGLAKTEAGLHTRSAALNALSSAPQERPDPELLVDQLTGVVNTRFVSGTMAPKLRHDAIRQYTALQSGDHLESILDRHIVAMSIGAMDCQARAVLAGNPKAIDMYLRHNVKMTEVLIQLVEARERRRAPKQPLIGNVNVGAGGQAIVANIEAQRREQTEEQSRSQQPIEAQADDRDRRSSNG